MFEDTCMILCSLLLELSLILNFLFFIFLHSSCVQFQACRWFYILYYLFGKCLKRSGLYLLNSFLLYKHPYKTLIEKCLIRLIIGNIPRDSLASFLGTSLDRYYLPSTFLAIFKGVRVGLERKSVPDEQIN